MKRTVIHVLAALAACTFPPPTAHAEEWIDAWPALPAHELAARRAGLRIGGLDVSVDIRLRDRVGGSEPAPASNVFQVSDLGGLSALIQLVNHIDNVRIQRDAEIRVRIDGFNSVFGSSAQRAARARLRATFE